jgi:hypothetical protein
MNLNVEKQIMYKIDENFKFNEEHLDYAVEILTDAFKRSLDEHIKNLGHKPDTELVAWRNALLSCQKEIEIFIKSKYQ